MGRFDLSRWILIISNIIPIFGVLTLGWDAGAILVIYWLESVIIGLLNIPKILSCEGGWGGKIYLSLFFTVHYGMFSFGHGFFLNDMIKGAKPFEEMFNMGPIFWTAMALFVSHFISLMINFYGKQEYVGVLAPEQMFKPYGRVMLMHFVVIIGGALVVAFGQPVYALILLVGLKIIIDIIAHRKSHRIESGA